MFQFLKSKFEKGSHERKLSKEVIVNHTIPVNITKSESMLQITSSGNSSDDGNLIEVQNPAEFLPCGELPDSVSDENRRVIDYYLKECNRDSTWEENPSVVDSRDVDTPDKWVPRHADLIRLTGRHPFNCEPPLAKLFNKGFITPASLHYVRNHGPPPKSTWSEHTINLGGLAPNPISIKMKDLIKLPMHSLPVTLVCCGNRRKEQNMIKQTIGFNWGAAGVATGVWTGVRLSTVLKLAGIPGLDKFDESMQNMHIRIASEGDKGGDNLPAGVYGTSVPLFKALDDSQDILVAFAYNGKLLSVDHGFPVRIIIPGYIGGRMIKWVTNIDLLKEESQDYYHFYDNKVLPSHVDAEKAKTEDWWHRSEYICNDLNINSAIVCPDHNETLNVSSNETDQITNVYRLQGFGYTGGGRKVTRSEISFDSGATWKHGKINIFEKPTIYGKYWCWNFWECTVTHKDLINANEIVLRCWDSDNNSQPDKPTWNVMGMQNNPWFRIKIHKSINTETGNIQLQFEHPTLAGNQNGGWMSKLKEHPSLTAPGTFVHGDQTNSISVSESSIETNQISKAIENKADDVKDEFDPTKPSFTMEEIKQHNTPESAWIVVNKKVYDCTPFLKLHPGGSDSIMINAGTDCSEEFDAIHSKKAWKMLDDYYIGQVRPISTSTSTESITTSDINSTQSQEIVKDENGRLIALNPKNRIPFKLRERIVLSPDSLLLRFDLQSSEHILGLPVGQHMLFSAKIDNKLVMRAYTPTSSDYDIGYFDLVIKVYYANTNPCYPEGGKMSQYLNQLKVGDSIDVKGPLGHVVYKNNGLLYIDHVFHQVKKFSMLCAGTGITPIYQVICAILRDNTDTTEMFLLYSNRYEEDILLKTELDILLKAHPDRLHIYYMLSKPRHPEQLKDNCSIGRVNSDIICKFLPPGGVNTRNYALLCGPDGFLEEACNPGLKAHNYPKDMCVYF